MFFQRHCRDFQPWRIKSKSVYLSRFNRNSASASSAIGFAFENFQRGKRFVRQVAPQSFAIFPGRQSPGRSPFATRVFARRFAELLAGLRHVQNVVNHLEREADVIAEIRQRLELRCRAVGAHAAEPHGTAQQRGGLALVDVAQFGRGKFFAFAFQIRHLPGDELQRAGRLGDFQNQIAVRIARPALGLRGDFKRLRQQRVAREHGDAFAEDLVVGRLATAEIVVVHRGQIIVDERVGVDALHGAGERHGVGFAAATGFGGGEAERGAHAFAAGKERIAHGFVDGGWPGFFGRQEFIERGIDGFGARGQELPQIEWVFGGHDGLF